MCSQGSGYLSSEFLSLQSWGNSKEAAPWANVGPDRGVNALSSEPHSFQIGPLSAALCRLFGSFLLCLEAKFPSWLPGSKEAHIALLPSVVIGCCQAHSPLPEPSCWGFHSKGITAFPTRPSPSISHSAVVSRET